MLGLWPSRLTLYTWHGGGQPKWRYVLQLTLPFVLCSLLPLLLARELGALGGWLPFVSGMSALAHGYNAVWALGAAVQVPTGAQVAGVGFRNYWRMPGQSVTSATVQDLVE